MVDRESWGNPSLPRRDQQRSQPSSRPSVLDLRFSERHLDLCCWDLSVGTGLRCAAVLESGYHSVDVRPASFRVPKRNLKEHSGNSIHHYLS
jgi:hypothetical protein